MHSKTAWIAALLTILLTYTLFNNTNHPLPYSRQAFGSWDDEDRDCQNLRAELLIEQSLSPVTFRDKYNCIVDSGQWKSKYTNKIYYLAADLEIDHVIPLKYAWDNGADRWNDSQRIAFYNDPLNLAIVEREVNRGKGAKGMDHWLPKENVDWYKDRWYKIHSKYELEEKQMTIIVGHKDVGGVWLAADSAASAGWHTTFRTDRKIFKSHGIGYGFTTSYRMGQILQYHSEEVISPIRNQDLHRYVVTCLVPMWRKILSDNGYTKTESGREETGDFLVAIDGRLFSISSDMQVGEREEEFDAVGCGSDYALGSMYWTGDCTPEQACIRSVETACYFSNGCGGRIDTLFVEA